MVFLKILHIPESIGRDRCTRLQGIYNDAGALNNYLSELLTDVFNENNVKNKRVLLKPNWVNHFTHAEDELCLRTHDNFILAILNAILKLEPSEVMIGDAPIQGCRWDRLILQEFSGKVNKLSNEFKVPVRIIDFRRRKYTFKENSPSIAVRPLSDYIIFDLGNNSLLEPITEPGRTKFRVTNYDPDRMSSAHAPGVHKYCIAKEFFDADIVISLPKIKTHQKTGITGALKNLVGINGDKDFLPHHRIGGAERGGDCYPGRSSLRYWSEQALDAANRRQGKRSFWFWQKLSSLLWRISLPGPEHTIAAGWHGNDTTWRMVMDINRIAEYGNADGTISEKPQRQIYSLCDAIIAGQGDGPLSPEPLPLGIISFTNNSVVNDRAMALLMGFPVDQLRMLNNSYVEVGDCDITWNGKKIQLEELKQYSIVALPPKGWADFFKKFQ